MRDSGVSSKLVLFDAYRFSLGGLSDPAEFGRQTRLCKEPTQIEGIRIQAADWLGETLSDLYARRALRPAARHAVMPSAYEPYYANRPTDDPLLQNRLACSAARLAVMNDFCQQVSACKPDFSKAESHVLYVARLYRGAEPAPIDRAEHRALLTLAHITEDLFFEFGAAAPLAKNGRIALLPRPQEPEVPTHLKLVK